MRALSRCFAVIVLAAVASTALAQSPDLVWSKKVSRSAVNAVQFSPNGGLIASASDDGKVRVWNATDGRLLGVVADHYDAAVSLAFSSDGSLLATGGVDATIHLIRMSDLRTQYTISATGIVEGLAFSPDGQTLGAALGYFSRQLSEFRVSDGMEMSITRHHWGTVWSVDYSRDGAHVVTAGADGRVLLYDVPMWNPTDLTGHEGDAIAAKFSPNCAIVASAGEYEARLNLHDVATGGLLRSIDVGTIMHSIAFTPDSRLIAIAGQTWPDGAGRIAFHRVRDGALFAAYTGKTGGSVHGISISPDGTRFVYGRDDGVLCLAKLGTLLKP